MNKSGNMNPSTLLLIHQLVNHLISNKDSNSGSIKANLERIGNELGIRIMMKVSDKHSSKVTRDTSKILMLFATEFWEFVFGKPAVDIRLSENNSISFKDHDFELISRINGENTNEAEIYIEYIRCLIISMFEGSLAFLNLKTNVIIQKHDEFTLVEIKSF